MKLFKLRTIQIIFLAVVAAFAAACGKKNVKQAPVAEQTQVQEAVIPDTVEDVANIEGSLRDKNYIPDPELAAVHFDYDKSELSTGDRETLRANAAVLKKRPSAEIQVAGHCDERGTNQYNIALGQRRANAVRNYYKFLGVKMSRMSTISYGEELPACNDSTEECWSQNRRAETLVRKK